MFGGYINMKKPTLPPLFPVEKEKRDSEDVQKHIAEILQKVLKKRFPNEDFTNSMAIATTPKLIGIRPNNLRRYIEISGKGNSSLENLKRAIDTTKKYQILSFNEHNKLMTLKYKDVMLQIGKTKITAIYEQARQNGEKFCFKKEVRTIQEAKDFLIGKIGEIKNKLDDAMQAFCHDEQLHFIEINWQRGELGLFGDKFLDAIPAGVEFHSNHLRKLYEDELEGISGKDQDVIIDAINFYENRLKEDWFVKDVLPIFNNRIELMFSKVDASNKEYAENIKLHMEVQKQQLANLRLQNKLLKENNRIIKALDDKLKRKKRPKKPDYVG